MAFDGFGNFTRVHNWTSDKNATIKITSVRHDEEDDGFATAFNLVILRSGVAAMTGDFKMGGNKITGVGAGAVGTPSVAYSGDATTGLFFPAAGVVALSAAGGERVRANNTGVQITGMLGIGTATPRTSFDVVGISSVKSIFEDTVIAATGLTGTVHIDATTAAVWVLDANAAGNWTFNIRGDSGTTLNSIMGNNQTLTFGIEVPQGATAYYCTTITVDGGAPTQLKWFGGVAPTSGNVSSIDVYSITVIKKSAGVFYVRASQIPVGP